MIINEKQVMQLMSMLLSYYSFLALLDTRPELQQSILALIDEIQNQQAVELKRIE